MKQLTKGMAVTVNTKMPGPTASEGIIKFVEQLAKDKGVSYQEAEADFFQTECPSSLLQRFASVDENRHLSLCLLKKGKKQPVNVFYY